MRLVRRASVVFSLVLIVAIGVGYLGRTSEAAEVRDERLVRSAEVGAARVDAVVDSATVAALSATSPRSAVDAVRRIYPSVSACAGDGTEIVCDGPLAADIGDTDLQPRDRATSLVASDDVVVISADGPEVSLRVVSTIQVWIGAETDGIDVVAGTLRPPGGVGTLVEADGIRQTSAAVLSSPGTFVIASTDAAILLPADERWFYTVVAVLAVVLFFLAGATLIVDQRSLRERATYDALTHLPNRHEFEQRATELIAAAERQEKSVCLLLFDLNGFKQINDTWGHAAGDEILRVVGRRLTGAVRDGDLVARWGGDEFVALMPGIGSEEMGVRRARQIAELVGGRTRIDGVPESLRVRASVGVALSPMHAGTLEELVDAADDAMYRAKRDGGSTAIAATKPDRTDPVAAIPTA